MALAMRSSEDIRVIVKDTSGEEYETDISSDAALKDLAAEFFAEQGWPTTDAHGRGQRAVVELVDPDNPGRSKRLRSDQTADEAGLFDGAVLRIFPEAIAGIIDERERIRALVTDHQDMLALADWNPHIRFETNKEHAPTLYTITFDYISFKGISADGSPVKTNHHRVQITLGGEYPRTAPHAKWLTPIFHPNIAENGEVCLGVLKDRYLPGLGVSRVVIMLSEMAQYRNFDMTGVYNKQAGDWVIDPNNWEYIRSIGGSPFQGPVGELLKQFQPNEDAPHKKINFRRMSSGARP